MLGMRTPSPMMHVVPDKRNYLMRVMWSIRLHRALLSCGDR